MARGFDPAVGGRNGGADPVPAAAWYVRAVMLGDTEAPVRLKQLENIR